MGPGGFLVQDNSEVPTEATLTWTGNVGRSNAEVVVGRPTFLSPEQVAGQTTSLTLASDIYSLGAILYCLLTGKFPFQGDLGEDLVCHIQKGELPCHARSTQRYPGRSKRSAARRWPGYRPTAIPRPGRWRKTSSTGWLTNR